MSTWAAWSQSDVQDGNHYRIDFVTSYVSYVAKIIEWETPKDAFVAPEKMVKKLTGL